jgi:hypothetical protein
MPISAYSIRTGRVPLGKDNDFEVRALTFPDLTAMVTNNMPALIAILSKYQEARDDVFSKQNVMQLATMVARDFPNLATEIISNCIHGEPVTDETRQKVALLPAPIQMMALVEISRITVEEAGGLGNLMADFRQRVQDAMAAGQSDPSPIQNA